MVEGLLCSYKELGLWMSVRINFLPSHLDYFPNNWVPLVLNKLKGSSRNMCNGTDLLRKMNSSHDG
jgi:hypothetical protein